MSHKSNNFMHVQTNYERFHKRIRIAAPHSAFGAGKCEPNSANSSVNPICRDLILPHPSAYKKLDVNHPILNVFYFL